MKKNGASGDADGVGCYDRIIPTEAMICCRRWGLPKSAAKMITTILNNTVYRLRTGHGISARTYMFTELQRILGVDQGSCASPAIWMAVLDLLLWSLGSKFHGFRLKIPSGININRIGDAYVDDVVLTMTYPTNEDDHSTQIQTLQKLMEVFLQDFERKLYTTGGEMSLKKTCWYMIA